MVFFQLNGIINKSVTFYQDLVWKKEEKPAAYMDNMKCSI